MRDLPIAALLAGFAVVLGAAFSVLATGQKPVLGLLAPVLLLPIALWRHPRVGLYLIVLAAVTIEQFKYGVGPREGAVTADVPAFQRVMPGGVNLVELLLLVMVVIVVMRAVQDRAQWLHRSPILAWLMPVLCLVATFLALGLLRGGDPKSALWEIRPYVYFSLAYILAATLITDMRAVRPLFWIFILGSGAKAIYGLTIFASIRHLDPRPEAVLAHEESFFFGLYIFITTGMWLFGYRDRLRTVATLLLPFVLLCDMVNSRRTAWLILITGMALLTLIAAVCQPERRKAVVALMVAGMVGAAVYLPMFWSSDSTIAQPARAVRSAVSPDPRDKASNEYREIEDYNIKVFIKQSRSLGMGYGRRLEYFGLVDLTKDATMLAYVPHNGVLYQWLRLGILGILVFTTFLTQAMISAVRLSFAHRREVGMVGAIVAATLIGYVAMGVTDMGFFWFRNALAMGALLGVVDGLRRMARRESLAGGARVGEAPPGAEPARAGGER